MDLTIKEFTRGIVASLVEADVRSIQPKRAEQRKALRQVWQFLSKETERVRRSRTRDETWLRQVIRLRNAMSPGPTGAFDQFETALRDLQLSFTESPNPSYEDVDFTVSKPFAKSRLEQFDARSRVLIRKAADFFLAHSDRQ
jgi:hypothetical protein